MKYFSTFSGIGGFELGIQQFYENREERCKICENYLPINSDQRCDECAYAYEFADGRRPRQSELEHESTMADIASKRTEQNTPTCVGFSEIDKYAIQIYQQHFPNHKNYGDITKIAADSLPDFDLFVGGFPCQSFSVAGKRMGFEDTRGTLFFDIARILREKQPRLFLLENVKGLLSHDGGRTFKTIVTAITQLGYDCQWQVLNSKNFGVPQNRERVFIIGHLRGTSRPEIFPFRATEQATDQRLESDNTKIEIAQTIRSRYGNGSGSHIAQIAPTIRATQHKSGDNQTVVIEDFYPNRARISKGSPTLRSGRAGLKIGTLRTHKDGKGFREIKSGNSPTIPARAREDGSGQPVIAVPLKFLGRNQKNYQGDYSFTVDTVNTGGIMQHMKIRRLTPVECERLQGFPDNWTAGVSDTQRYKCLGNAVTVNVVRAILEKLINTKS